MVTKKKAAKKAVKKRANKYEEKLAVNLSFDEIVKVSLSPTSKPSPGKSVKKVK